MNYTTLKPIPATTTHQLQTILQHDGYQLTKQAELKCNKPVSPEVLKQTFGDYFPLVSASLGWHTRAQLLLGRSCMVSVLLGGLSSLGWELWLGGGVSGLSGCLFCWNWQVPVYCIPVLVGVGGMELLSYWAGGGILGLVVWESGDWGSLCGSCIDWSMWRRVRRWVWYPTGLWGSMVSGLP